MFERFSHRKRILELEEAVSKLQRDVNRLDMELSDTLSKLRSVLGRIVKRDALSQEREDAMMGIPPKPPVQNINSPHTGLLTDRQREIQQGILRRRAGG